MPATWKGHIISALRPYVTAGVALVGASVIAVTPVAPAQTPIRVVDMAVSLSAATTAFCPPGDAGGVCGGADVGGTATPFAAAAAEPSIMNVPANLFNAIANIPASQIAGLNLFAKSLEETGSLLVWSPTNVFGFDQADPDKLKAVIDLLIPFPALSTEIARQSVIWAQANFPVNPGCAALPGACPHPEQILGELLQVPTYELYNGYTFPSRVNPFDGSDVGYPDGYVKLDPNKPAQDFLNSLLAPPTGVQTVTLEQVGATFARLGTALFNSFYPFVQNSEYYNPDETGLAYVFRALSPFLCANCNRDPANGYAGVYDNPFLYQNYNPQYPPATDPAQAVAPTTLAASGIDTDPLASTTIPSELAADQSDAKLDSLTDAPKDDATKVADTAPTSIDASVGSLPTANLTGDAVDSAKVGITATTPPSAGDATVTGDGTKGSAANASTPDKGAGTGTTRGKHWQPGAQTSVPTKIKSTISKLTGGFGGGDSTKLGGDTKNGAASGSDTAAEKKPSTDKTGE